MQRSPLLIVVAALAAAVVVLGIARAPTWQSQAPSGPGFAGQGGRERLTVGFLPVT